MAKKVETKKEDTWNRVSFNVPDELYEKIKAIPHGIRASVLRMLIGRAITAAEEHGTMIYGAIIDGSFILVHKEKEK